MKQMILKKKHLLAEDYLRKCLTHYSGHFSLISKILTKYSKLIKGHYEGPDSKRAVLFMIETVKKAAI